ncbi:MAG TPA: hypothetical protein PKD15_00910 [Candidatus Saccharibacteria bacterium]|nr:hypothetical protein [Candidatus Saccharibacteria bacterium]
MSNYPTEAELKRIESWDGTPRDLLEYLHDLWEYQSGHDWVAKNGRDGLHGTKLYKVRASTWGWSGNEDIMASLEGTWFNMLFWWSSRRGGHNEYHITPYWIDRKSPHGFGKIVATPPNKEEK